MNASARAITVFKIIAAAALLASAPGHAGKIVTESNADGRQNIETLEFNDKGYVRITSNGMDSLGMIARDKRVYFFGELKGKPVVVDMLAAAGKLQAKGMKRPESDPAVEEIAAIKPTGRKQTVAGVDGEVHVVTWALAGKSRTEEIVLTRDPRLAGVIQGLALDPGLLSQKPRKTDLKAMVHALGAFLLQSPGSVVTSADFSPTPDARFALNAKPGDDVGLLMQIVMSAAFGALGQAVGAVTDATGKAMSEAFAKPEPQAQSREPAKPLAGDTPLHKAARNGDNERVKALLAEGADVNAKSKDGEIALHLAAYSGHKQIAELLIAKGAPVDARDNFGMTPLREAAYSGHREMADFLLSRGADINAKTIHGDTPLHWSAFKGSKGVAELLLAKGADVNARKNDGGTPLHLATFKGEKEIAEMLIARGADVNARTKEGMTPLLDAIAEGRKEMAQLLIAKGADVNAGDNDGDTALHWTAIKDRKDIAELLLARRANVNARNKAGETPLQMAMGRGKTELAAIFKKHGARTAP